MGEYWIIDGTAHFADGDVGDDNHTSYVVNHILDIYNLDQESYDSASLDELFKLGMTVEEYNIVSHRTNDLDPREYAMEKWGWKRLAFNDVETFTITKSDFDDIYRGLSDAYWDQYEDNIGQLKFNLYVYATKKFYEDIPFGVFENGSISDLREFASMRY